MALSVPTLVGQRVRDPVDDAVEQLETLRSPEGLGGERGDAVRLGVAGRAQITDDIDGVDGLGQAIGRYDGVVAHDIAAGIRSNAVEPGAVPVDELGHRNLFAITRARERFGEQRGGGGHGEREDHIARGTQVEAEVGRYGALHVRYLRTRFRGPITP
jgi:hypothetical protein